MISLSSKGETSTYCNPTLSPVHIKNQEELWHEEFPKSKQGTWEAGVGWQAEEQAESTMLRLQVPSCTFPGSLSMSATSTGSQSLLLLIIEGILWHGYTTFIKRSKSPWSTLWKMSSQMCSWKGAKRFFTKSWTEAGIIKEKKIS